MDHISSHNEETDINISKSGIKSSIVCSAVPPEIIEILELTELSEETLGQKLSIIKTIPNGPSFFSAVEGDREDTSYIWFIVNYRSLLQSESRGNEDAKNIIDIVQTFVKEDVSSESNIEINDSQFLKLEPVKTDMSHLSPGFFTYGFRLDIPGFEGTICYNMQGYKEDPSE